MATALQIPAQITLEQYLQTTYRPDCDYVDGSIEERNVGKWEHSRIQGAFMGWFWARETRWQVMAATEQRVRVSPTRIRIPDVLVLPIAIDHPEVITVPPLIVIEVLSPDDTYARIQERAADFRKMGCKNIWIVDPDTRTARCLVGESWERTTILEVAGTPISIDISDIFPYISAPNV